MLLDIIKRQQKAAPDESVLHILSFAEKYILHDFSVCSMNEYDIEWLFSKPHHRSQICSSLCNVNVCELAKSMEELHPDPLSMCSQQECSCHIDTNRCGPSLYCHSNSLLLLYGPQFERRHCVYQWSSKTNQVFCPLCTGYCFFLRLVYSSNGCQCKPSNTTWNPYHIHSISQTIASICRIDLSAGM